MTDLSAVHADPVVSVLLWLAVILLAAKVGAGVAGWLGQPAVLGELVAGVVLGSLALSGVPWAGEAVKCPTIEMLGQLGVILLLFEVGLESTVGQMLKVGASSALVAVLGVVTPFALGWLASAIMLPAASPYVHAFVGATLTATSVGITARVLRDQGLSQRPESRIIMGAAVLDDVLGLVILAAVAGAIGAANRGESLGVAGAGAILGKAFLFLIVALLLGRLVSRRLFALASLLRTHGVLLALSLGICFLLAWLSALAGLAPIVGAFAAGLVLEHVHFRNFTDRGEHALDDLVRPIVSFLAPIFFVLMGARTDISALIQPGTLGLAAVLTVAAVAGKLACVFGVLDRRVARLPVALGMVPRGEVGLIFANVGLGLTIAGERVIDPATYSAVIVMVFATTMAAPPLLSWSFRRRRS